MPKSFLIKRILSDEFDEVAKKTVKHDNEMKRKLIEDMFKNTKESYWGEKEPEEKAIQSEFKYYYEQYHDRYHEQFQLLNHYFMYLHQNKINRSKIVDVNEEIPVQKSLFENQKRSNKVYPCKVCTKTFDRSSSLSNHMLIHNNSKSFKCKKCDLCFLRKSDLSKHEVIHSGEKPYKCQTCGKRFSQSSNMLTHQRRHTGIRPFACKICGKSFYRKVDVRRHHLIHRN